MNGKAIFQGGNAQSLDNIAGQPIAEYTHSKSGTIHKLEGPEKARNIVFKATGDYNDGDTWTLNNHPVIVTYNGGEELLPTAVLVGDVVQAVVMESKLRLMLQKPTPQESLIENGHFVNPINQRGKTDYTTVGYTIDRWRLDSLGTVSIGSNKIILTASSENTLYFSQLLNVTDKILDKIMTFSVLLANGSIYYATGTIREGIHITNISSGWISCYMINTRPGILFTAGKGLVLEPVAAKLEPGNRFTGWPVWDYGAELEKCRRYFRTMVKYDAWSSIGIMPSYIDFPLSNAYGMRDKPTIINAENFDLFDSKDLNTALEGFTFSIAVFGLSVRLRATKRNYGITGSAFLQTKDKIYLSSEL